MAKLFQTKIIFFSGSLVLADDSVCIQGAFARCFDSKNMYSMEPPPTPKNTMTTGYDTFNNENYQQMKFYQLCTYIQQTRHGINLKTTNISNTFQLRTRDNLLFGPKVPRFVRQRKSSCFFFFLTFAQQSLIQSGQNIFSINKSCISCIP